MDIVYVQFGLAMCLIALVSLIGTAWLAARFNRGAKRDLDAALTPLAEMLEGEIDLDEARVTGRYEGHLVEGRMINTPGGGGRAFRTELIDSAGGTAWSFASYPARKPGEPQFRKFESDDETFGDRIHVDWDAFVTPVTDPKLDRFRLEYDPEVGALRLIRPMRTRRDLPDTERFIRQLDLLVSLAQFNRGAQGAPDANWSGGRRDHGSQPRTRDDDVKLKTIRDQEPRA